MRTIKIYIVRHTSTHLTDTYFYQESNLVDLLIENLVNIMSLNLYSVSVSDMCSRLPYALNSETAEAIIELRNSKPNFDVIELQDTRHLNGLIC